MRDGVYVEGQPDVELFGLEDGFAARGSGVGDEDCGVAEFRADGVGGGGDGGVGCEVGFEVVDVRGRWRSMFSLMSLYMRLYSGRRERLTLECQWLDIHNGNPDAALSEQLDYDLANAIASSCHDYQLLAARAPIVHVVLPIVDHVVVQEPADF